MLSQTFDHDDAGRDPFDDIFKEITQDYDLLNDETLCEIEEIAPEDLYSDQPEFDKAAEDFFDEADFEDAFHWRI